MAERIAKQTFNSMYLVMSQGWNRAQLEKFIRQMEVDNRDSDLQISIFRGAKVNERFGEMASPALTDSHREVLLSGKSQFIDSEDAITYFICFKCQASMYPMSYQCRCWGYTWDDRGHPSNG